MFHVINTEFGKVAGNNPPRALGIGLLIGVALGLLIGRKKSSIRLLDGLRKVFAETLLLDNDVGFRYAGINEGYMTQFHLVLEGDEPKGLRYTVYLLQKFQPKGLGMLLFVTDALPFGGESLGRCFLLGFFHVTPPDEYLPLS